MFTKFSVILAIAMSVSACGAFTPREIAEPSNVTVRDAVFEVADTLRELQNRVPVGSKSGLIADEVTVVFNVAASSDVTNKAGLTISNVPLAGGSVGGNAEVQSVSSASRGNTITIKFKNIATADIKSGPLLGNEKSCPKGYILVKGICLPIAMLQAP
jgi:bacterioferritin-associated ferredoxin